MKARTLARLLRSFDRPDDMSCWTWRKATDPNGYGRVWLNGGMRLAHRAIFQYLRGPIPEGLVLDHLCRNTGCVNPRHLDVVTQAENLRRGRSGRPQAERTHCPQEHEYTEANTYRNGGRRFCRACHNAATRARKARLKTTVPAVGTARTNHTTITKEQQ